MPQKARDHGATLKKHQPTQPKSQAQTASPAGIETSILAKKKHGHGPGEESNKDGKHVQLRVASHQGMQWLLAGLHAWKFEEDTATEFAEHRLLSFGPLTESHPRARPPGQCNRGLPPNVAKAQAPFIGGGSFLARLMARSRNPHKQRP